MVDTASARVNRLGCGPRWARGEPPPCWIPPQTRFDQQVELYAEAEKQWAGGWLAEAPSQDGETLVRGFGCSISPAFLLKKKGSKI